MFAFSDYAFWRLVYALPNLLAAFGMLVLALFALRYRAQRGGWALCALAFANVCWALGEGMGFVGLPEEQILFFWRIGYIGVTTAPLLLMLFAVNYAGFGHRLTPAGVAGLFALPLATLAAAWSKDWQHLIWIDLGMDYSTPIPTLANRHGPLLWLYFAYAQTLALLTGAFLLWRLRELPPPQRRQFRLVLAALAVPALANLLYMTRLFPLRNVDLTPLAFNLTVFLLIGSLLRERLFELAPVTSHEIYRSLEEAVFVIDDAGRLIDANESGLRLLSATEPPHGRPFSQLLPAASPLLAAATVEHNAPRAEIRLGARDYDVRLAPLRVTRRSYSARLLVWRDISARKALEADLRRLATTDVLTGCGNRLHFFQRGEEEIARARRNGRALSLILLDIDHFKRINDRHGHESGDYALAAFAKTLNESMRAEDFCGRIGGEEFAMLLPEASSPAAAEVCRRLLDIVRRRPITLADGSSFQLSASAGIATLAASDERIHDLLRRADAALYAAKDGGRDRWCIAPAA